MSRLKDARDYARGAYGCLATVWVQIPWWRKPYIFLMLTMQVVLPGVSSVVRGVPRDVRNAAQATKCKCLDEVPDWLRCDACPRRLVG